MKTTSPQDRTVTLPAPDAHRSLFESVACERGYVTSEQIAECRSLQEKLTDLGLSSTLGEVLVKRGYLSRQQAAAINSALGNGAPDAIPGYRILCKIGEGGMGAVYKATQTSMDRLVALKVLLPRMADETEGRERFVREARAAAKLSHPNVVAGIDAGEANGIFYFVMEYLDGEPLDVVLRRRRRLPWREALAICRQMALALGHAHEHGMVHRDVKPGNIMLLRNGAAKLADLGLVHVASTGDAALTQSGMIVGSPAYVSPEQAQGMRTIDIRSDIYSLGLTLFELIAGDRAYTADNPMAAMSARLTRGVPLEKMAAAGAPVEVIAVVAAMTQREPDARYETPRRLLEDIEAVLAGGRPAHALGAQPPVKRRFSRRLTLMGFAAATLLGLATLPAFLPERTSMISLQEALARASALAPGAMPYHVELEVASYSVDFDFERGTLNLELDMKDGTVRARQLELDDFSSEVAACQIPLTALVTAALEQTPGRAIEARILLVAEKSVVEVRIASERGISTVYIDGVTGRPLTEPISPDDLEAARRTKVRQ